MASFRTARLWVTLARGSHPLPSRTRKLSPSAPMVLRAKVRGRVGRRPSKFEDGVDFRVCADPVPPKPVRRQVGWKISAGSCKAVSRMLGLEYSNCAFGHGCRLKLDAPLRVSNSRQNQPSSTFGCMIVVWRRLCLVERRFRSRQSR